MSTDAALPARVGRDAPAVDFARGVLRQAADCLQRIAGQLDERFADAVHRILDCRGQVIVTGMGKAGLIGEKVAATLASTGTRSHFMHPAEAVHGDLGCVRSGDVVLAFSKSGETEELVRLLPALAEMGVTLVAVTTHADSSLARSATVTLPLGQIDEACHLGLAPSTSTTAMLALGDALALAVSRQRRFRKEDFNRFHPGGSLGRRLGRVEQLMRPLGECRVARAGQSVREVFVQLGRPGRRSGAVMLVDEQGRLEGLFTDSDLARLFEGRCDAALDGPISAVMTRHPFAARLGDQVADAVELLARRKISELPVVDESDRPRGLLDITDLVGLLPAPFEPPAAGQAAEATADCGGPKLSVFQVES